MTSIMLVDNKTVKLTVKLQLVYNKRHNVVDNIIIYHTLVGNINILHNFIKNRDWLFLHSYYNKHSDL